uniref:Uncharacterized protein n=1 Tax=Glossina pallidipes TaxID=7398 RepID=A0A1B0A8P0_GLOPL
MIVALAEVFAAVKAIKGCCCCCCCCDCNVPLLLLTVPPPPPPKKGLANVATKPEPNRSVDDADDEEVDPEAAAAVAVVFPAAGVTTVDLLAASVTNFEIGGIPRLLATFASKCRIYLFRRLKESEKRFQLLLVH